MTRRKGRTKQELVVSGSRWEEKDTNGGRMGEERVGGGRRGLGGGGGRRAGVQRAAVADGGDGADKEARRRGGLLFLLF